MMDWKPGCFVATKCCHGLRYAVCDFHKCILELTVDVHKDAPSTSIVLATATLTWSGRGGGHLIRFTTTLPIATGSDDCYH
jgi:hypothetical protein